jgi:tetratricopeptide (TPR) repeat protein
MFLAGLLCCVLLTASAMGQKQPGCAPDKTFTEVGVLLRKQAYDDAKRQLRELESCPHLSPIQRFNVGWLYGKAHDSVNALRIFKSLPGDIPDRLTHGYSVALASFQLGHYQDAVDSLTALRSTGTFDAKCADLLGVSLSKLDRYQDAYDVMAENIRQNPNNPFGYFNLIALFVDTSEMDKAGEVANKAVAAFPQSAEALSMRGSIELFQNRFDDAYRDFAAAADLTPSAPDPRFFMALVDYRLVKFDQAQNILKDAIDSGIADSDLHYLLAECLIRLDATDRTHVLAELNEAVALNPRSMPARVFRGSMLLEMGRAQEALADLKIAQQLDPTPQRDTRNPTYLLGRAYAALGRQEEAKAQFAQLGQQLSDNKSDTLDRLSEQKIKAALHP